VESLFTEEGFTDMYLLPTHYRSKISAYLSWATKRPKTSLGATLQLLVNEATTQQLLRTYLGTDPGDRVFNGSVSRGDGVTVRSVIWFSDIRQFSKASDQLSRDDTLALVNDVFEVTHSVIAKNGGEVLKFIGDGLLAIFTEKNVSPSS
jgi:adenylate cyclase